MVKKASERVWRTLLVKGGNFINLQVKVIREHVLHIVCEPYHNLKNGKETFHILKGAVLVRNTELDADGHEFYMIFNGGIYDALRSQAKHVSDGIAREGETISVMQGSFDWGLRQTWYMTKETSSEDLDAYSARIGGVANHLRSVRDDDKVKAKEKAVKATSPRDAKKRINGPSRGAILWSANQRLDKRKATTRRISPRIATRAWDLTSIADLAWGVKHDLELEVNQAMRWWKDGRTLDTDRAEAMALRLEKTAGTLRSVSIAPYSRRGFPRIADDLDLAATHLRQFKIPWVDPILDRCRRAFLMMDARKKIEEICTTASRVHKAKIGPTAADVWNLVRDLDEVIRMLFENGRPLDHDFKNPVIETKVIPFLTAVRAGAIGPDGYNAKIVYAESKAAAQPL